MLKRAAAAALLLCTALAGWCFWLEPDSLRVNRYPLPLLRCPPPLADLRIALIADLHAGAPWIDMQKIRRLVQLTNAASPDLVVLAGDYVAGNVAFGSPMPPQIFAPELGQLHARLGVYAVLGNHDHAYGASDISAALTAAGIRMLDNQAVPLARDGATFWLAGLAAYEQQPRRTAETLARVPADAPLIVFAHQPYAFAELPPRVNLMLAGHTHGGQINLPLLRRLLEPAILEHLAGHYREQTDLFVTRGIGTTALPARLNASPEIALLVLHSR